MAGQVNQTNAYGGFHSVPHLTEKLHVVGEPMARYGQFTDVDQAYGVHENQSMYFDKIMDVDATTADEGRIAELQRIPMTRYPTRQGTITCYPRARGILFTLEYKTFSQIPVEGPIQSRLYNHSAKSHDRAVYNQFNATKVLYIPTGSSGSPTATWDTDGTVSTAATRDLQAFDMKNIIDALKSGVYGSATSAPVEPYDGNNYVGIVAVSAARALKDDPDFEKAAHFGDPDRIFNYEVGRIWDGRIVEDNHILTTLGTSGYKGSSFWFGKEPVKEIVAIAEEIRVNLPDDHGRLHSLAWYSLKGYKIIWEYDATNEPDNRIVNVTST